MWPYKIGIKVNWLFLVNLFKNKPTMKALKHRFVIAFGTCAIIVSLCSGCATQPTPTRVSMATHDLNHFVIDCRRQQQQIDFLQSIRVSDEERTASRLRMMVKPWEAFSAPQVYWVNYDTAINNHNKYINFLLKELYAC